jgi:hypothetical protein
MIDVRDIIRALSSDDLIHLPVRVLSEEGDLFDIKGFQSDGSAFIIEVELSE